jgi:hypothetical protein
MLTISLAGCITDSTVEQITDDITEVLGCMEESALNYDENATGSVGLCLSEDQLLLAEEMFWSSWDTDVVKNAAEPIGYRLIITETSVDENRTERLEVQEVFSSEYYDQKILLRNIHEDAHETSHVIQNGCQDAASSLGLIDEIKEGDDVEFEVCHYSSQTVFDNSVQVGKYSDGEWDNYSMKTAASYDSFRNRLEGGPGIRSSDDSSNNTINDDDVAVGRGNGDCNDRRDCVNPGFPPVVDSEYTHTVIDEVELSASGHQQAIYYFAEDKSTGTEVELMGVMTEDGFKITEICAYNHKSTETIIGSYMGWDTENAGEPYLRNIASQIILLESDGEKLHFAGNEYSEPVDELFGNKPIPFYFGIIPDLDTNETENKSTEGKKGLNAVNVKVVIAGPSGPYGMEGDLSDYRLVISNCTLDNATTGVDDTTKADEEDTSARSIDNNTQYWRNKTIYGSAGNSCTDLIEYDLASGVHLNGTSFQINRSQGGGPSIIFVDADSSGTLSEGDRFEFSDNNTIYDLANMIRLFSISADGYSDENINPSSKMSVVHEGAMNAIRNIRAVAPDDTQSVTIELEKFVKI